MPDRLNQESFRQPIFRYRFIGGFQDTRTNKEDFALTPFLFGVWVVGKVIKVRGVGICWGFYSVYLALGKNIPVDMPAFTVLKNKD